jgi:DHA1 family bicyclomycin/chloramphenicol resistance-like MFS transporter
MSIRRSHMVFFLLTALSVAPSFSTHAFLPALPEIQETFAVSTGVVQLTLSLAMVSIAAMTLVYGPMSDRYGRRPAVIAGMVMFLSGSIVCMLADSIWLLIVGRVIQVGGAAAGMVLARTIARDIYGSTDTARVLSYLIMATVVGSTLSPTIGGLLTDGLGWRSVFVTIAAFSGVIAVAVTLFLRETNPDLGRDRGDARVGDGIRRLIRNQVFWGYALLSALAMAIFFSFLAAAPYLMSDVLHQPARAYGLWFIGVSLSFMVGNYTSTRLLRRYHMNRLIETGVFACLGMLIVSAGAMAMLPLSPAVLFLPAALVAALQGLIIANGMAGAMDADPNASGAAAGMTTFLQMAISAVFAQIVGVLENGTVWPMIGAMLVASVTAAIVALRLLRTPAAAEAGAAG